MAQDVLSDNSILRDRYKILRRLGGKELSNLYIAQDLLKNKYWVIKELINAFTSETQRAEAIQQFQFEARLLINLEHPQLPRIEDFFEDDKKNYLVMEYIEGKLLEKYISEIPGFMEEAEIRKIGIDICEVLEYLHSQNPPVIFRDLKPSNIMLDINSDIRLIDFGIARFYEPKKAKDTTPLGTPGYSPPEQYGRGQTSPASDIYSLGATLYYLLSGIDPAEFNFNFPPIKKLNKKFCPHLDQIIATCLNLDPRERYKNAQEVKEKLERWNKEQKWYKNFASWLPFGKKKEPESGRIQIESKETRHIDEERLRG